MRKLKNEELNRKTIGEFKTASKIPVIIVLDNIRSLHNVGAVFRTADAFVAEEIYLCGITATPPNKEIRKTALGATESVTWKYFKTTLDALETLTNNGYNIYAIEQAEGSILLNDFMPRQNEKFAIVFGNEIKGVEQNVVDRCTACIEIPQAGTKHSLNVSVSMGIVIWDIFSKMRKGS